MEKIKYFNSIEKIDELSEEEKKVYSRISEKYKFRTNSYYNALINWDDENDPLRKIIIPDEGELLDWGVLDASLESQYQPVSGLEHKYSCTALLLCNDVCGAYCRFCFRKRLFQDDNDEVQRDVSNGIAYINNHPEINNVLLTGGDPLMMSTRKVIDILDKLKSIPHVKIIRFGTKMLGFEPSKICSDQVLLDALKSYTKDKQIYFMLHFNHTREITSEAKRAIRMVQEAGVTTVNQTPIIRGVNDNEAQLSELFSELSFLGVVPYYVFACRPTEGNYTYAVPIEEAFSLFSKARSKNSGLAKTARFIMSYSMGKIEVLAIHNNTVILKKHNWVISDENEQLLVLKSNPNAYWFDEYEEIAGGAYTKHTPVDATHMPTSEKVMQTQLKVV